MDNIDKVRAFIVETFLFGDGSSLKDDSSFLQERIVDSTGILEIITFLEEEFSIKINDDDCCRKILTAWTTSMLSETEAIFKIKQYFHNADIIQNRMFLPILLRQVLILSEVGEYRENSSQILDSGFRRNDKYTNNKDD